MPSTDSVELKNIRIFLLAYRGFALVAATLQISLVGVFPPFHKQEWATVGCVGIYALYKVSRPSLLYRNKAFAYIDLGTDFVISSSLPLLTGGIESPFLLYCLCPVLTSGLLYPKKITFSMAGAPIISLVMGQLLLYRFFPGITVYPRELALSLFGVYTIISLLVAWLPYMMNINVSQRVRQEAIMRERNRLSREMHDGVNQSLAIMRWKMEILRQEMETGNLPSAMKELEEVRILLGATEQEARQTVAELRHSIQGFVPTLSQYATEFTHSCGIRCDLHMGINDFSLPPDSEHELLHIVREALTNIRKHSGARMIDIALQCQDGVLEMTIRDDGKGFSRVSGEGHGITIMIERAKRLGGEITIESTPGVGTEIKFKMGKPALVQDSVPSSPKVHFRLVP